METMTQVAPAVTLTSAENRLAEQINDLMAANGELQVELTALREDDPEDGQRWLQMKVRRQAVALNRLQNRVRTQRLVLRELDDLGRSLTDDEWAVLRSRTTELADTPTLYV